MSHTGNLGITPPWRAAIASCCLLRSCLSRNFQVAKLATRAANRVCSSLQYGATHRRHLPIPNHENASHPRIQPKDISAESDWLQDRDVVLPTFNRDHVPPPRFDWRMRASSRTRKNVKLEGSKLKIRRHAPPVIDVKMGQPFFEEINAYQER